MPSVAATLCCNQPTTGDVWLSDELGGRQSFIGNKTTRVSWTGFTHSCSGVHEYQITLMRESNATVLWASPPLGAAARMAELPLSVLETLPDATDAVVAVTATSRAGLSAVVHVADATYVVADPARPTPTLAPDTARVW